MIKEKKYDVVIVGAGPGGLFCCYKLLLLNPNLKIALVDKGENIIKRECPALVEKCENCNPCNLISGAGGAGLFIDGKLVFDLNVGGHLKSLLSIKEKSKYLQEILSVFRKFDGDFHENKSSSTTIKRFVKLINKEGLKFKYFPVKHLGSLNSRNFVSILIKYFKDNGVDFLPNTQITNVETSQPFSELIANKDEEQKNLKTKFVVFSVGKENSKWLSEIIRKLGGNQTNNACYFGVRIEVYTKILDFLFNLTTDPKIYKIFKDGTKIKTHCFCKNGQILLTKYYNLPLVGGHSIYNDSKRIFNKFKYQSHNSNFAILLRDNSAFSFNWEDCLSYMKKINELTHGKLLVQRLGDFLMNRPTTIEQLNTNKIKSSIPYSIYPGNIAEINLPLNYNEKLFIFLKKLNKIVPGLLDPDNLIYAPAIEWWMPKIEVNKYMETDINNIFTIGDGAGLSQGIVHAAATGILAAIGIFRKMNK